MNKHTHVEVLALIPARGGSKGIPRKNIKQFCGKPLMAWTIEEAKKSRYITRIIVSTDDEEIAERRIFSRHAAGKLKMNDAVRLVRMHGGHAHTLVKGRHGYILRPDADVWWNVLLLAFHVDGEFRMPVYAAR